MLQLDTAERAIETFERLHGLNVTVHDLVGNLAPFLKAHRVYHRSPLCLAVKACGALAACLRYEHLRVRQAVAALPEGRVHVCHANLVEWVVPAFNKNQLAWVVYAGPRLPGKTLVSAIRDGSTHSRISPFSGQYSAPSPVEEDEALMILEHLRQVVARLEKWMNEAVLARFVKRDIASASDDPLSITRQISIRRFIEQDYSQPITLPMLAQRLGLSESRTSHLVRESCCMSFRELLIEQRLKAAMHLLQQSDLSVLDIALASGFQDVTHFHRLFRRRIGTTPLQYRRAGHC